MRCDAGSRGSETRAANDCEPDDLVVRRARRLGSRAEPDAKFSSRDRVATGRSDTKLCNHGPPGEASSPNVRSCGERVTMPRSRRVFRRFSSAALAVVIAAPIVVAFGLGQTAQAAGVALYPDLKTLPPRELRFDRADITPELSGDFHNVLRFSNTN